VIVDVPVNLNILHKFSKQASTVVTSKLLLFPPFQNFRNFHFLGKISEITKPICEIDAIIHVAVEFHDAIVATRTPLRLLLLNQIVTSASLQMA